MSSEEEAMRVRDFLHGKSIYGSRIRVNFMECEPRNQFWRRKHGESQSGVNILKGKVELGEGTPREDVVDGPPAESCVLRRVGGLVTEDYLLVLQPCAIGWCQSLISNSCLAEETRRERISGVHVMWISGSRVLLIFYSVKVSVFGVPIHAWSCDNFERLVSHWGSVVLLEEATLEHSSFKRGRMLIKMTVIERIVERLELSVGGFVFFQCVPPDEEIADDVNVRLKMPPEELVADDIDTRQDMLESFHEAELGEVCWRGNGLWNGHEGVTEALVPTVRDQEQLVDVVVSCVGPIVEGSTTETPEEKRKATKEVSRWGRSCPRKSVPTSAIADISLSDSDLLHLREAILKEAAETVEFGKLLDAKTIGCEAVIVQDIAQILAHSQ
ncbi:hypothetical protein V6N11_069798 [Hibiscus sabdariffa]|uniref:DUF4283 domain-containing protein n=1 Tax=Hibiscus sabdariffa TaxID=183260 RepID=A0ABR2Q3V4_9ROSI